MAPAIPTPLSSSLLFALKSLPAQVTQLFAMIISTPVLVRLRGTLGTLARFRDGFLTCGPVCRGFGCFIQPELQPLVVLPKSL